MIQLFYAMSMIQLFYARSMIQLFYARSMIQLFYARSALLDEKRRLEARISALEDELEDEQGANADLLDKARKATMQFEQCQTDLQSERSVTQKLETQRMQLERSNKEMKVGQIVPFYSLMFLINAC